MNNLQLKEPSKDIMINNIFVDLDATKKLCQSLLQTPHYSKLGADGVFAVIETAKSLNVDPRQALGGGLYYVKGKVEMSARLMNALIRAKKHSITRDKRSDETICILHGKRADNGDTWTESFSWEEAQRAGLTGNATWKNYTRDMLFARALSRLARQLFPDVIGNCYVEGELSYMPEEPEYVEPIQYGEAVIQAEPITAKINESQVLFLKELDSKLNDTCRQKMYAWMLSSHKAATLEDIPQNAFDKVVLAFENAIRFIEDQAKVEVVNA